MLPTSGVVCRGCVVSKVTSRQARAVLAHLVAAVGGFGRRRRTKAGGVHLLLAQLEQVGESTNRVHLDEVGKGQGDPRNRGCEHVYDDRPGDRRKAALCQRPVGLDPCSRQAFHPQKNNLHGCEVLTFFAIRE
eukprot:scaffold42267_cov66-Phaeocystis_antarctica.AAC.1